jgi:hypothetical protein
MHTRRRYLATLGLGLAGLAGCLSENGGSGGSGTDDPDGTDDTTERPSPTDDPTNGDTDVTVTDPVVRKAVTHYAWPGSTRVFAPEGEQFVVATVEGPEETAPPGFTLEAGDREFDPGLDAQGRYSDAELAGRGGGSVLQNEHATGYLAFRVPSPLDVDDARIVRDDGGPATPLSDGAVATLRRPGPEFELETLEVPESVERPAEVDVSLTVTNASDVDGRFLAGVNWPTEGIADDDETTVLERDVAAAETTTLSLSLPTGTAVEETTDHPLTVEGCVAAERTIEVIVDETTTADAGGS